MCYAQENHLDEFEKEVSNVFKKKQNNEYYHDNRISFTSSLTDKMREFDFVSDDNFKKRPVITYILDRFTALSLSEREKIYYHIQYKTIDVYKRQVYYHAIETSSPVLAGCFVKKVADCTVSAPAASSFLTSSAQITPPPAQTFKPFRAAV